MKFISRGSLPVFTPRLDLTAEELNEQTEILIEAINELAGRVEVLRLQVKEDDRKEYSKETSYPILDNIQNLWDNISNLTTKVNEIDSVINDRLDNIQDYLENLEIRLNTLDDSAARKEDLAVVLNRKED